MKKTANKILALFFLTATQMTFASEYNMEEINQMVEAVKENNYYKHIDTDGGVIDFLLQSAEFTALQNKCKNDWDKIIDDLNSVDGVDGKKLVFWAVGQLAATDYMTFLEKLTTKYEAGALDENLFKSALFAKGRMRAFAVDNHSHARLIAVLNRVKTKTADNTLKNRISKILSGDAKEVLDNYRDGHQGLPEGNIPKVLLAE